MRGVDIMLCFPSFFLILSVIAFLEPSLTNIMIVIGLTSWMGVARLVRAETLSLRQRDFVSAARLSGCSTCRILLRHIPVSYTHLGQHGPQDQVAHDHGVVTGHDRRIEQLPQPRQGEDGLDDDAAADEPGYREAQQGDDREQGLSLIHL